MESGEQHRPGEADGGEGPPHRPSAAQAALAGLAAAALGLGLWLKMTTGVGGPLWLDEGWTLGIVDRPGWGAFVEQLRLDVNPPLYFLLLRGWTAVAGLGDAALRAPSTVFAILAGLTPLLAGRGLPRTERWAWAAVLGLLPHAIAFAQEARGYALLLALEAGAAVAFLRLLQAPRLGRAALWTGLTSLALLTHHHALPLAGLQGLALLAMHRGRALRLWPAVLLFAPWLAWTALQAPRIMAFAQPQYAWYSRLDWTAAPALAQTLTAGAWPGWGVLLALGVLLRRRLQADGRTGPAVRAPEALTALTAVAAASILIVGGVLRPSFTPRYLVPELPGVALGLVLALRIAAPAAAGALQALLVVAVGACAVVEAARSDSAGRRAYQIETASADLARAGVRRLAFLWDNPTDGVLAPAERSALADAFFVRAGRPVQVIGVRTGVDEDPNARLAAAPADAVLWLYDLRVPRTAARRFPPRLEAIDPRLSCRRYAGGALGVVACVRSPLAWTK